MDHEYKLENDAQCLGASHHELKRGTKITFDTFGSSHCPICDAAVNYSW